MDTRPTTQLPAVSVSSGSLLLLRLGWHARIAERSGIRLTNLDLSSRVAPSVVPSSVATPDVVTTIWTGNLWANPWGGTLPPVQLRDLIRRLYASALVIDLDGDPARIANPGSLVRRVEQTRQWFGRDRQVMVAIRGQKLAGGRQHLAELTSLRHLAEEWDLGLALDLTGMFDPTWEAEAAVMRLGNQLKLLRVPSTAMDRLAVGRDRVCNRALAAAVDQGVPPEIVLLPVVPWYQSASIEARAESVARAATAIANRVVSVKTQRARFLGQDLWPNLRG